MFERWFSIVESKLIRWGQFIVRMLPNFILAILVMIGFIIVAKFIKRISEKIIKRISKSDSISGLTAGVIYTLVIIVGMMISLNILKLDKAVTSLLAGVGIVGLALGFAFQDLTANFISGAFIAFKRPFDVGHVVETNGFVGTIEDIQLRATVMRTFAGLHVIIPNKDIFQKPIINYSLTGARRIELEFHVSNKTDLHHLEQAVLAAIHSVEDNLFVRQVEVYFMQIEDPRIKMYVSVWTAGIEPSEFMRARHFLIKTVVDVLKAEKVIQ